MSPEELHDEMVNKAEFDSAYVDTTANAFNTMSPEDISRFMAKLSESQASYTPEQRANLQKLNLALAQKPAFNEALKRFSDWRAAQQPPAPAPSDAPTYPPSPDGVLAIDEKTRRTLEKKP